MNITPSQFLAGVGFLPRNWEGLADETTGRLILVYTDREARNCAENGRVSAWPPNILNEYEFTNGAEDAVFTHCYVMVCEKLQKPDKALKSVPLNYVQCAHVVYDCDTQEFMKNIYGRELVMITKQVPVYKRLWHWCTE